MMDEHVSFAVTLWMAHLDGRQIAWFELKELHALSRSLMSFKTGVETILTKEMLEQVWFPWTEYTDASGLEVLQRVFVDVDVDVFELNGRDKESEGVEAMVYEAPAEQLEMRLDTIDWSTSFWPHWEFARVVR